ncbi:MAG: hypothetical protein H6713_34625 [Myxococcales bacterium]|nr:hypothetical protein [Myxococcales bacterium]
MSRHHRGVTLCALWACLSGGCGEADAPAPAPAVVEEPAAPEPAPKPDVAAEVAAPDLPRAASSDREGPEIRVLSPARGEALKLARRVKVTYEVVDAESELGDVTINGEALAGDQRAGGAHEVIPRPGLNLVKIVAKDEHGNQSTHVQSFYAAAEYRSVASAGRETLVPEGLTMWLGQEALDAGADHGDRERPRDLASVLEVVLASLKGDALVGRTIKVAQSGFKGSVTITGVERGPEPEVRLQVEPGRLTLNATVKDARLRVRLDGTLVGLAETSVSATVKARSVTLSGAVDIRMLPSGVTAVRTRDLETGFHGLEVSIDNNWGSAVNWLIDMFDGEVDELLTREIKARVKGELDAPLARALNEIAVDQTIAVPPLGVGGPTRGASLRLRSQLESLEPQPRARRASGGRARRAARGGHERAVA